jgi:hypothetical protein
MDQNFAYADQLRQVKPETSCIGKTLQQVSVRDKDKQQDKVAYVRSSARCFRCHKMGHLPSSTRAFKQACGVRASDKIVTNRVETEDCR